MEEQDGVSLYARRAPLIRAGAHRQCLYIQSRFRRTLQIHASELPRQRHRPMRKARGGIKPIEVLQFRCLDRRS